MRKQIYLKKHANLGGHRKSQTTSGFQPQQMFSQSSVKVIQTQGSPGVVLMDYGIPPPFPLTVTPVPDFLGEKLGRLLSWELACQVTRPLRKNRCLNLEISGFITLSLKFQINN